MYQIILHNYVTHKYTSEYSNNTKTLISFNNIANAQNFVEEFISDYIVNLQGDKKFSYIFKNPPLGNSFKEGCFVKLYKQNYLKYSVYKRHRYIGYIMNSQDDVKHFDIMISMNKEYCEKYNKEQYKYCSITLTEQHSKKQQSITKNSLSKEISGMKNRNLPLCVEHKINHDLINELNSYFENNLS